MYYFLVFIVVITFNACSTTTPQLAYTGGNYHSISDDIVIQNAKKEAITKLANTLKTKDKILIEQIGNNEFDTILVDQIYEELLKRGFLVAKDTIKGKDKYKYFNHKLSLYASIKGTEHASTRPSTLINIVSIIPFLGPFLQAKYNYEDRVSGVNIHTRYIAIKSGETLWIKNFSGQNKIRLRGGLNEILFPK